MQPKLKATALYEKTVGNPCPGRSEKEKKYRFKLAGKQTPFFGCLDRIIIYSPTEVT
jgi:hypothetical protein